MDVIINENQIDIPVEISTWGDLLDWVETEHLQAGQCITHVYLGGKTAWSTDDVQRIDAALPGAMADRRLNNVIAGARGRRRRAWKTCP